MSLTWPVLLAVSLFVYHAKGVAADFYVDPVSGHENHDGSYEKPWPSLKYVFRNRLINSQNWPSNHYRPGLVLQEKNPQGIIKGGDTIWLKSGHYGGLSFGGFYNTDTITIQSLPGQIAHFDSISITSSAKWKLSGLLVERMFVKGATPKNLVRLTSHPRKGPLSNIEIVNSTIRSTKDISDWEKADWLSNAANGINVKGDDVRLINNQIYNVNFGVIVRGQRALVSKNEIKNFSGDGIRGLGDYGVFEYNTVKNNYAVDRNHDDAFQSWSMGPKGSGDGVVKGIVLRGNVFINRENPDQKFKGPLQGIGAFDGMFKDWVIENNVIMVNSWHGIALFGAENCRIINNTVIRQDLSFKRVTWITVRDHKNGSPSTGCTIRNNLTNSMRILSKEGMRVDHNIEAQHPQPMFQDFHGFNLALKQGSEAIDAGSREFAPLTDIKGNKRDDGKVDIGAFEYQQ